MQIWKVCSLSAATPFQLTVLTTSRLPSLRVLSTVAATPAPVSGTTAGLPVIFTLQAVPGLVSVTA